MLSVVDAREMAALIPEDIVHNTDSRPLTASENNDLLGDSLRPSVALAFEPPLDDRRDAGCRAAVAVGK